MWDRREKMGGPGEVVELDESLFQGKRKNRKGRFLKSDKRPRLDPATQDDSEDYVDDCDDDGEDTENVNPFSKAQRNDGNRVQGPWVFGIVWKSKDGNRDLRMFKVDKRDRKTLWPIIQEEVAPGTIIHSDEWKAYTGLEKVGFIHKTVVHKQNFIDPVTGTHTQTIESLWGIVKTRYGIRRCGATALLQDKLIEEWWRGLNDACLWDSFFPGYEKDIQPS